MKFVHNHHKCYQDSKVTAPQLPRIASRKLCPVTARCRCADTWCWLHSVMIDNRHLAFCDGTSLNFAEITSSARSAQWWGIRIAVRAFYHHYLDIAVT